MKNLIIFLTLSFAFNSNAVHHYYPQDYAQKIEAHTLNGEALKTALFQILHKTHQLNSGQSDSLKCDRQKSGKCYSHKILGYRGARKVLFGRLHLSEDRSGYYIMDVYCRKKITSAQSKVGPNIIPNGKVMNCEHTWPQSLFTARFEKEMQKSDLHHLFPTDSRANSVRGHFKFSDINDPDTSRLRGCSSSRTEGPGGRFEPPTEHKGNVARALFYFSVRYQVKISEREERTLRAWDKRDPIDAAERERNNMIYSVQKNRNPFIDFPNLANSVRNF